MTNITQIPVAANWLGVSESEVLRLIADGKLVAGRKGPLGLSVTLKSLLTLLNHRGPGERRRPRFSWPWRETRITEEVSHGTH